MSKMSALLYDYLAEIHYLMEVSERDDDYVPTADIAASLMYTQSTVNRVIERLREMALIEHKPYTGVRLTEKGRNAALECLRKQRILEAFLVNVMKFEWHEVYIEARAMRHNISETMLQSMWRIAGHPSASPFGEVICDALDEMQVAPQEFSLTTAPLGEHYTISRVMTRATDRLEYLGALGLRPGTKLTLLHRAPFDGPIQLQIDREYRIVGHELGRMIHVEVIATPEPA